MAKFKKQPKQQQLPSKEALKTAPQLPLEYHKCTICSASFLSISRLLSYSQNIIYGKPSYKHCESQFDSNNKLYKYLDTCSATKKFSNADIAVKKKGVDRTATS